MTKRGSLTGIPNSTLGDLSARSTVTNPTMGIKTVVFNLMPGTTTSGGKGKKSSRTKPSKGKTSSGRGAGSAASNQDETVTTT